MSKRIKAHHLAACDRYEAGHGKPPTRKQAQAWLAPIRRAFVQIKSGEVDAHRGYPITRIHHADNDFARIDHCINGFAAMLERLAPEFDACFRRINACEDLLITFSRAQLKAAALTEQVNIELERIGLKEAA